MHFIQKIGVTSLLFATSTLGIYPTKPPILPYTASSTPVVQMIWTEANTRALVADKAKEYGVNEQLMLDIIDCETSHKIASTTIQSGYYQNGERERSYGLVQINLYHNPDITYEQAIDPYFSIDFLAKQLSKKKGYLWSCYRIITN